MNCFGKHVGLMEAAKRGSSREGVRACVQLVLHTHGHRRGQCQNNKRCHGAIVARLRSCILGCFLSHASHANMINARSNQSRNRASPGTPAPLLLLLQGPEALEVRSQCCA